MFDQILNDMKAVVEIRKTINDLIPPQNTTVLHAAVANANMHMIETLFFRFQEQIKVNQDDAEKKTPFYVALHLYGHEYLQMQLGQQREEAVKENLNDDDKNNQEELEDEDEVEKHRQETIHKKEHLNDRLSVVHFLVRAGANPNTPPVHQHDGNELNILFHCCLHGLDHALSIVAPIVGKKNLDASCFIESLKFSCTPVGLAAHGNFVECAKILLRCGADVDGSCETPDFKGLTPLAIACRSGALEVAKLLVEEYSARIDSVQEINGWNILHHAAHFGQQEICEYLVSLKSVIDKNLLKHRAVRDDSHSLSMYIAGEAGFDELSAFLRFKMIEFSATRAAEIALEHANHTPTSSHQRKGLKTRSLAAMSGDFERQSEQRSRLIKASPLARDTSAVPISAKQLEIQFDEMDTDSSGRISKAEFKRYFLSLENYGLAMSDAEFNNLWSGIHGREDGSINFEEFSLFMLKRSRM